MIISHIIVEFLLIYESILTGFRESGVTFDARRPVVLNFFSPFKILKYSESRWLNKFIYFPIFFLQNKCYIKFLYHIYTSNINS